MNFGEKLSNAFGMGQEPEDVAPTYYSTGPNGIDLDERWTKFSFGFVANSVAIRAADPDNVEPIVVSFEKPFDEPRHHIHLDEAELPFSMGGERPLGTGRMWAKRADEATGDAAVEIVAMRSD